MGTSAVASSSELSRSLLNQYISNRNFVREVLNGSNFDTLNLLDLLDYVRHEWAQEVEKNAALMDNMSSLKKDLESRTKELSSSKEELRHARAQIMTLMSERNYFLEIERKFHLVKELIKPEISHMKNEEQLKYAFLNESTEKAPKYSSRMNHAPARKTNGSQDDGIDYDKTDDLIDQNSFGTEVNEDESYLRNGKVYRRSQNALTHTTTSRCSKSSNLHLGTLDEENSVPSKRSKGSPYTNTNTLITTATTTTTDADNYSSKPAVPIRRSFNRSMSESNILMDRQQKIADSMAKHTLTPHCGATSTNDLRTPNFASQSWIKGTTIESRPHNYSSLSTVRDKCDVCEKPIGWGAKSALKCNDCNLHVHKSCVDRAPLPCIPYVATPRTPARKRPRLQDFCPSSRPMIPHLIIHCVIALEQYYILSEGLYRIPGEKTEVEKLIKGFRSPRFQPKLSEHNPETITSCIKGFLNQLRDALIPSSSFDEFLAAVEKSDMEALDRCVTDLPIPNRDTLAYLCHHFQKVADSSSRNKMTPEVLARSVAPTIVRRNSGTFDGRIEAAKQEQIMLALLRMPPSYWSKLYSPDFRTMKCFSSRICGPSLKQQQLLQMSNDRTPRRIIHPIGHGELHMSPSAAADRSILGPIRTPPSEGHVRSVQSIVRRGIYFLHP